MVRAAKVPSAMGSTARATDKGVLSSNPSKEAPMAPATLPITRSRVRCQVVAKYGCRMKTSVSDIQYP
ncbi:hypothetical protein D3C71_1835080 [compost metagenome]